MILRKNFEFISFPLDNFNMKSESMIIVIGIIMVFSGFLLFYSIESVSNVDNFSRNIKHAGIFIGLLGIGVTIAGILLKLMGRDQPPIQKNMDYQDIP